MTAWPAGVGVRRSTFRQPPSALLWRGAPVAGGFSYQWASARRRAFAPGPCGAPRERPWSRPKGAEDAEDAPHATGRDPRSRGEGSEEAAPWNSVADSRAGAEAGSQEHP
ncbi:hypothetical protein GCM10010521_33680 [Streptomyces rameus]|uniref:Uncharacterized protein n=1 Tax=Streptomyces rameus TaxID=68261 RepID=A0ABP6NES2_9ACTN